MGDIPKHSSLRFGIPSLDDLFGTSSLSHRSDGIPVYDMTLVPEGNTSTRLTLVGPEGSGKSIVALHLAARYIADAWTRSPGKQHPKVIFVSTDLTYAKAL